MRGFMRKKCGLERGGVVMALFLMTIVFSNNAFSDEVCSADERPVFRCEYNGGSVSLCDNPKKENWLVFRKYEKSKIDLIYPSDDRNSDKKFKYFESSFAKGGVVAVSFWVNDSRYSVYSTKSVYGYNGSGFLVRHGGGRKNIVRTDCESISSASSLRSVRGMLPSADGDVDYVGPDGDQ